MTPPRRSHAPHPRHAARALPWTVACALIAPACASRSFNAEDDAMAESMASHASSTAALRDDGVVTHTGPFSPYDKVGEGSAKDYTAGVGLVSALEAHWACLSRPEVTVCRGRNGAGRGDVIWVRYRGTLVQRSSNTVPVYLRIDVKGRNDSFPMLSDAFGTYFLLTDGLTSCTVSSGAKNILQGETRSRCEQAPIRMRDLFKGLGTRAQRSKPWKVSVAFGVTLQDPHESKPRIELDKGEPPYVFELPESHPSSDDEGARGASNPSGRPQGNTATPGSAQPTGTKAPGARPNQDDDLLPLIPGAALEP